MHQSRCRLGRCLRHGQEQPPIRIDSYAVNHGFLRLGAMQHNFSVNAELCIGDDRHQATWAAR